MSGLPGNLVLPRYLIGYRLDGTDYLTMLESRIQTFFGKVTVLTSTFNLRNEQALPQFRIYPLDLLNQYLTCEGTIEQQEELQTGQSPFLNEKVDQHLARIFIKLHFSGAEAVFLFDGEKAVTRRFSRIIGSLLSRRMNMQLTLDAISYFHLAGYLKQKNRKLFALLVLECARRKSGLIKDYNCRFRFNQMHDTLKRWYDDQKSSLYNQKNLDFSRAQQLVQLVEYATLARLRSIVHRSLFHLNKIRPARPSHRGRLKKLIKRVKDFARSGQELQPMTAEKIEYLVKGGAFNDITTT